MPAENLDFKVNEAWAKHEAEDSWAAFILEFATGPDGKEYFRKKDSSVAYLNLADQNKSVCAKCGSDVLAVKVAHPIHEFPEVMAGSGQCHYEKVPYCPKCEPEPDFQGAVISGNSTRLLNGMMGR